MKNHRLSIAAFAFASVFITLSGCSKSAYTVGWYLEHSAEREAKLKWCNDDMARATDVDCLNATKAKERAMLQGPSAADSFRVNQVVASENVGVIDTPRREAASTALSVPAESAADSFRFDPNKVPEGGE